MRISWFVLIFKFSNETDRWQLQIFYRCMPWNFPRLLTGTLHGLSRVPCGDSLQNIDWIFVLLVRFFGTAAAASTALPPLPLPSPLSPPPPPPLPTQAGGPAAAAAVAATGRIRPVEINR